MQKCTAAPQNTRSKGLHQTDEPRRKACNFVEENRGALGPFGVRLAFTTRCANPRSSEKGPASRIRTPRSAAGKLALITLRCSTAAAATSPVGTPPENPDQRCEPDSTQRNMASSPPIEARLRKVRLALSRRAEASSTRRPPLSVTIEPRERARLSEGESIRIALSAHRMRQHATDIKELISIFPCAFCS